MEPLEKTKELEEQSVSLIKRIAKSYNAVRVSERAAALTFFTLIALVPLMAFMLIGTQAVAGKGFFERQIGTFARNVMGELPMPVDEFIDTALSSGSYLFSSILGALVVLWSITTLFLYIRKSLTRIFALGEIEGGIVRRTIQSRLLAVVYTLILFVLLLITMLGHAYVQNIFALTSRTLIAPEFVAVLGAFLSFLFALCFFSSVYILFSDIIRVKDGMFGGLVAAFLFTLINILFSIVLVSKTILSYYGNMGVFIAFAVYVYYMYISFFVGALAARHHHVIEKQALR